MIDYIGLQLGTYRLISLLEHGGTASVYLGQHVFFNTEYAIKVWQTPIQSLKQKALAEARTIVSLKHPHIIPVHYFDVDATTGLPFLVMDYASGGNLRQRHPEGRILHPATVCHYLRQVADALSYAHKRQIVHCDIKPENMLIGQQGDILLSDFGIAAVKPSLSNLKQREIQGTVEYMAPEMFEGYPSTKSDQYALGAVAYEWLCGDLPFYAETLIELIQKHIHESPPSLTQRMPTISPEIEQVVFRALAKDPAARFPEVQDFVQALSYACGMPPLYETIASFKTVTFETDLPSTEALVDPVPVLPVQTPARPPLRRAFLIAGLAAGLTILGGGTIQWLSHGLTSQPPPPVPTPSPTIERIPSDGLLTPGVLLWGAETTLGAAPYAFLDANSAPVGFEVDIANAIAQLMQITQACYQAEYTSLADKLRSRKIDIILNGWEVTSDRQQDESFSIPYYRYGQQLVVRANDSRFSQYTASSQITLADVKQYKFGTGAAYKAVDLLRATGITPTTSEIPLDDLNNRVIDIVMIDTPIVAYYVQGKGFGATPSHTLRPIGKPLFGDSTSSYVIGFKKNDPNAETLRKEIDRALLVLKQDGTLKKIYQQWGLWNDLQKEVGII